MIREKIKNKFTFRQVLRDVKLAIFECVFEYCDIVSIEKINFYRNFCTLRLFRIQLCRFLRKEREMLVTVPIYCKDSKTARVNLFSYITDYLSRSQSHIRILLSFD